MSESHAPRLSELIEPRLDDIPIGSILPFVVGEVPDDFLPFDGREIARENYPDLFEAFDSLPNLATTMFEGWGGKIASDSITLPDLDSDRVIGMIWGVSLVHHDEIALAIRAKKKTDAADT